jgi:hypothetical protein
MPLGIWYHKGQWTDVLELLDMDMREFDDM